MKKVLTIAFLACISAFICACGKFSVGDTKTDTFTLPSSFQVVEFCDDVNVKLLHSNGLDHPAGKYTLTTGENLFDNISLEIEEFQEVSDNDTMTLNKLVIRNNNKHNYLHSYNYSIDVELYYDSLYHLIFNSNARNISTDTLRGYNCMTQFTQDSLTWDSIAPNLFLQVEGGSGNFNVLTNCYQVKTKYTHGTSNLFVRGFTEISSIYADYDCHGKIDESELESIRQYITSYGTNIIIGKAFHSFTVKNSNIGHVYYVKYKKKLKKIIWGHFEGTHWISNDTVDTIYHCPQWKNFKGEYVDLIFDTVIDGSGRNQ